MLWNLLVTLTSFLSLFYFPNTHHTLNPPPRIATGPLSVSLSSAVTWTTRFDFCKNLFASNLLCPPRHSAWLLLRSVEHFFACNNLYLIRRFPLNVYTRSLLRWASQIIVRVNFQPMFSCKFNDVLQQHRTIIRYTACPGWKARYTGRS